MHPAKIINSVSKTALFLAHEQRNTNHPVLEITFFCKNYIRLSRLPYCEVSRFYYREFDKSLHRSHECSVLYICLAEFFQISSSIYCNFDNINVRSIPQKHIFLITMIFEKHIQQKEGNMLLVLVNIANVFFNSPMFAFILAQAHAAP